MQKKRKVWWIAGGVGFVVLFTFATLVLTANSADSKMEARLDELFEEHDFERANLMFRDGHVGPIQVYHTFGRTAAEAETILKSIEDACQDCALDWLSDGRGVYRFTTGDSYKSIEMILFRSDIAPVSGAVIRYNVKISVFWGRREATFLDRVKNLWPW